MTYAETIPCHQRNTNTGIGSVYLATDSIVGRLTVDAQEYTQGADRTLIVRAQLGERSMYRSVFSQNDDSIVFLHMRDGEHTTTIILADSSEPSVGDLTVWNDNDSPEHFRIDIPVFLANMSHSACFEGKKQPDQIGRRDVVALDPIELYRTFRKEPTYQAFMRGQEPEIAKTVGMAGANGTLNHAERRVGGINWKCAWICFIPACGITCLFWKPNKEKKKDAD